MGRIEDAIRKLEEQRQNLPARQPDFPAPLTAFVSSQLGNLSERGSGALQAVSLDAVVGTAVLDPEKLRRWGPMGVLNNDERAKHEYGQIKRPIINRALGRTADKIPAGNIVVVTSALASEGKSLTAFNLALSLARERDLSVVLLDADLVKPDLSRTLGLSDVVGFTDLIADTDLQLRDVLWRTSVDRLFFVPAGRERTNATELVGSHRARSIVDSFARALPQTILLIDSSPLLLTNESPMLVSLGGQTIFVVRANSTPRLVVAEALARLDPSKPVGLVLNGADGSQATSYGDAYFGAGA